MVAGVHDVDGVEGCQGMWIQEEPRRHVGINMHEAALKYLNGN